MSLFDCKLLSVCNVDKKPLQKYSNILLRRSVVFQFSIAFKFSRPLFSPEHKTMTASVSLISLFSIAIFIFLFKFSTITSRCGSSMITFLASLPLWGSESSFRKIQKQPPRVSFLKAVIKNFAIFTGKHLCWSLLLIKTPTQVFSYEYCKIFKNYFKKHLRLKIV